MSVPEDSMRELASLAGVVLGQEDLAATLEELTRIAVRAVPPTRGASVTTAEQGKPATVAASDDWAKSLDELQYVEHEGPCIDCWRSGIVLRVRDLADDSRWPFYGPRAAALGARSSVSLPLAAEGKIVGALNLYATEPDSFDTQSLAIAELLAAHVAMAMQVAAAFFGQRDLSTQLREAMESRAVIEQAKGILMMQHKVSADAAFELLRGASQQSNTKLRDVAQRVVDTGAVEP
jgi:GAF domain-containing protein